MTRAEYEALRANRARFAVSPHEQHVVPEVERVVQETVEELYFRGHLLPRIDRGTPVLNTGSSLCHFWTPWQNIGRILGLLPWIHTVWRKRSVALSMAVHISVNCIFLLLVLAAVTAD